MWWLIGLGALPFVPFCRLPGLNERRVEDEWELLLTSGDEAVLRASGLTEAQVAELRAELRACDLVLTEAELAELRARRRFLISRKQRP
jgi:hypothetical protein